MKDFKQAETAMFLSNNPYGFRLNINHSRINELYRRYKVWKGLPSTMPLSDEQRHEFEKYILNSKIITPPKT